MNHILKVRLEPYERLSDGRKTWEARLNDRDYQVGDTLALYPFNERVNQYDNSKPRLGFTVTDVQTFGMAAGYVGLSLSPGNPVAPEAGEP